MPASKRKEIFEKLSSIKLEQYIKRKKIRDSGKDKFLSYISWATAWKLVCKEYPNATFSYIYWNNKPYLFDEVLGYLVGIEVNIEGEKLVNYLPVMDGQNRAMKDKVYTYQTSMGERRVAPATFFDINTAWQRCLVKTLALFGLGIDLYTGEDLEEILKEENEDNKKIISDSTKEDSEVLKYYLSQQRFDELVNKKNKAEIIKTIQFYDGITIRDNKIFSLRKEQRDLLNQILKE